MPKLFSKPPGPNKEADKRCKTVDVYDLDAEECMSHFLYAEKGSEADILRSFLDEIISKKDEIAVKMTLKQYPDLNHLITECQKGSYASAIADHRTTYRTGSQAIEEMEDKYLSDSPPAPTQKTAVTFVDFLSSLNEQCRAVLENASESSSRRTVLGFSTHKTMATQSETDGDLRAALNDWRLALEYAPTEEDIDTCEQNIKRVEEALILDLQEKIVALEIKKPCDEELIARYEEELRVAQQEYLSQHNALDLIAVLQNRNRATVKELIEIKEGDPIWLQLKKAHELQEGGNSQDALQIWENILQGSPSDEIRNICEVNRERAIGSLRVSRIPPPLSKYEVEKLKQEKLIETLTGELKKAEKALERYAKEAGDKIANLERQLSATKGRAESAERQLAEARGKLEREIRRADTAEEGRKLAQDGLNERGILFGFIGAEDLEEAKTKLEKLKADLQSATERAENASSEKKALFALLEVEDLQEAMDKLNELKTDLQSATERAGIAESDLETIGKAQEERDILFALIGAKNLEEASSTLEELNAALLSADERNANVSHERDTLFELLGAKDLKEAMEKLDKLKADLQTVSGEKDRLDQENGDLKKWKEERTKRIEELQQSSRGAENRARGAEAVSSGLRSQLTAADRYKLRTVGRIENLETNLKKQRDRITELKDQLGSAIKDLRTREGELRTANEEKQNATGRVTELEQELTPAKERADTAEAKIQELEAKLKTAEGERNDVQGELDSLRDQHDEFVANTSDGVLELEDKSRAARDSILDLKGQIKTSRGSNEKLTKRLKTLEKKDYPSIPTETLPSIFEPRTVAKGEHLRIELLTGNHLITVEEGAKVTIGEVIDYAEIKLLGKKADCHIEKGIDLVKII